jgi:hypothetical protein
MEDFLMRISVFSLALMSTMFSCSTYAQSLNQGLQNEKSYTRHAMEAYRKNPRAFQGNKSVLDTWSRSDYIAIAVAQQQKGGKWAETSDKLGFLEPKLRHDVTGRPFCVIQQADYIAVLSIRSGKVPSCSLDLINGINIERINSGEMEFSGRTDYWIYVLRPPKSTWRQKRVKRR